MKRVRGRAREDGLLFKYTLNIWCNLKAFKLIINPLTTNLTWSLLNETYENLICLNRAPFCKMFCFNFFFANLFLLFCRVFSFLFFIKFNNFILISCLWRGKKRDLIYGSNSRLIRAVDACAATVNELFLSCTLTN